jgi:hypothetical protein
MASRQSAMKNSEEHPRGDTVAARQKSVLEIICRTSLEDYDGHTEFARMTPAERLAWLDQAVLFIESRRAAAHLRVRR